MFSTLRRRSIAHLALALSVGGNLAGDRWQSLAAQPPSGDDDPFADLFLEHPADRQRSSAKVAVPPPDDPTVMEIAPGAPLPTEAAEPVAAPTPQIAADDAPTTAVAAPTLTFGFPELATPHGYQLVLAGPVHEALLSRLPQEVAAGEAAELVTQPPPAPLVEQPPGASDQVPAFTGNDVRWISGYWAWFADAGKYVWVSGLYRDVPPGRQWQAGSWQQTLGGYRWNRGYWAAAKASGLAETQRVSSLPPPPRDEAPSDGEQPHENAFWIAGEWRPSGSDLDAARESAFHWQPGFWAPRAEQWIWQPAHYVPAGDGFVFVSGYWDYEPHFRGQAYAAVSFPQEAGGPLPREYQPRYPLARPLASVLHLFCKPTSHQYFYGDFYDPLYAHLGYRPWYMAGRSGVTLGAEEQSPLLEFYQWKYRQLGIDFVNSMLRFEHHFRTSPSVRPAAQLLATPGLAEREGLAGQVFAATFETLVSGNVGGRAAVRVAADGARRVASR